MRTLFNKTSSCKVRQSHVNKASHPYDKINDLNIRYVNHSVVEIHVEKYS